MNNIESKESAETNDLIICEVCGCVFSPSHATWQYADKLHNDFPACDNCVSEVVTELQISKEEIQTAADFFGAARLHEAPFAMKICSRLEELSQNGDWWGKRD